MRAEKLLLKTYANRDSSRVRRLCVHKSFAPFFFTVALFGSTTAAAAATAATAIAAAAAAIARCGYESNSRVVSAASRSRRRRRRRRMLPPAVAHKYEGLAARFGDCSGGDRVNDDFYNATVVNDECNSQTRGASEILRHHAD